MTDTSISNGALFSFYLMFCGNFPGKNVMTQFMHASNLIINVFIISHHLFIYNNYS